MKQGLLAVQQAAVNQPSAANTIGIDLGCLESAGIIGKKIAEPPAVAER
jgi:hypothetical protein